ncbi:MAG: precorrin-6A reductase [Planctomycetaceae bacterium]|nr:precorrin-6A reductase [Planctomycetaceae bacterium]
MNLLLFAGTGDGRILAERLATLPLELTVSVATEYGHELLLGLPDACRVTVGRLDEAGMRELIDETACAVVVDATHPYAAQASATIRLAAESTGTEYMRLVRRTGGDADAVYVESAKAAAKSLMNGDGNILLTIGSKNLDAFTIIPGFADRVFPRVLPMEESLRECIRLRYRRSHIIAMQGPFGAELNLALMRQYHIRHLVTKDGGATGGFPEKMRAAAEAGVRTVVIGRPAREEGLDVDGIVAQIRQRLEHA